MNIRKILHFKFLIYRRTIALKKGRYLKTSQVNDGEDKVELIHEVDGGVE